LSGKLYRFSPIVWSSTPQAFNFIWEDAEPRTTLYTYQLDSETLTSIFSGDRTVNAGFSFFGLSNSGLIAYNGASLRVSSPSGSHILSLLVEYVEDSIYGVRNFLWHPSADWLLLTSAFAGAEGVFGRFTLVDVYGGTQQFLTDCPENARACFGWLP
jgi:hypothetical protein